MREYDNIRTSNQHILDERFDEVYERVPQMKVIDQKIIELSMEAARARILGGQDAGARAASDTGSTANGGQTADTGNSAPAKTLADRLAELNARKVACLKSIGKPADYLESIYTCKACKDTGYVGQHRCSCFKKKVIELVYLDSNLKNITENENFENFSYEWYSDRISRFNSEVSPLDNIKKCVGSAKKFVANFDTEYSNLILYGTTGIGKTFLSNCIAKELLDTSHSVIYLTATELFDRLAKKDYSKNKTGEDSFEADYLTECDLLIIDDLGTEVSNTYTSSRLFYIINERLLRRKSIIISTNLTLKDLAELYSDRILSRLAGTSTLLYLYGDDIRTQKASR
jgi:DNA replication protein DnaC